ncbi:hypothetical protein CLOBOL_00588 [Enterocloster bolteae ATCC BAA-613]|uniref:Uncharacterized protein n=1 Tax=Enterocloster bolteae (strain ATCC BAA-613 / DSM 15670 / CCUG 46953 / JCM 12243 / WAL 16351) TaxID=411902 RepID=A8RI41_ENTBW|nr:hypothetical protein CLOBOL_00588 [Enterocloster bolteae ATCC BAA-613]
MLSLKQGMDGCLFRSCPSPVFAFLRMKHILADRGLLLIKEESQKIVLRQSGFSFLGRLSAS